MYFHHQKFSCIMLTMVITRLYCRSKLCFMQASNIYHTTYSIHDSWLHKFSGETAAGPAWHMLITSSTQHKTHEHDLSSKIYIYQYYTCLQSQSSLFLTMQGRSQDFKGGVSSAGVPAYAYIHAHCTNTPPIIPKFRVVQNLAVFADTAKITASAISPCVRAPRKLKLRKFLRIPSEAIPRNYAPAKTNELEANGTLDNA